MGNELIDRLMAGGLQVRDSTFRAEIPGTPDESSKCAFVFLQQGSADGDFRLILIFGINKA